MRKIFGLRHDLPVSFYVIDFWFRRILRQNAGVTWAVHHTSTVHSPEKIVRGKWVFPGDSQNVYINAKNGISIGDYTNIGPSVGIISANHDFINNEAHSVTGSIVIGRHCWFGMGSVVLPGVVLGDFTIVGAGTIVTRNFEEGYCVLAGNPAKVIKQLNRSECDAFAQSKV